MNLSTKLVKDFAKQIAEPKQENDLSHQVYGTIVIQNDEKFVQLDGANEGVLTPLSGGYEVEEGDRVVFLLKDHALQFLGNLSDPSVSNGAFGTFTALANANFENIDGELVVINEHREKLQDKQDEYDTYITIDPSIPSITLTSKDENGKIECQPQPTESEFNANKTHYWIRRNYGYLQCEETTIYNQDEIYYELGETQHDFAIKSDRISFIENGNENAFFSGDKFLVSSEYITNYYPRVKIESEEGVQTWAGSLAWIARINGHFSLKCVKQTGFQEIAPGELFRIQED